MSDQLFERAVRDWLEDGSDRTPRPAMEAVLLAIKTTPQERDLRIPRRFTRMPTYMRLAAAVAVLAIVGVGALTLFKGPDIGSRPTPAPTASPTAPPLTEGSLDPGRYRWDADGLRVTMTVPAGWESTSASGIGKAPFELPDGVNLGFAQPATVFGDPCDPEGTAEPIGPTVDDLVTALADLPNVTGAAQADATISGFSGKHLSFVVDTEGIDCVMGLYGQGSFVRAAENGQRQDLWIVDVAGTRLVIDAATFPETPAGDRVEMQAIVDTLLIESTG